MDKIRNLAKNPEVYLNEIQARGEVREKTIADIQQAINNNEKQFRRTIDEERRKVDLLTPEAFKQERILIEAKRAWLQEEKGRLETKLANLQQNSVQQEMVDRTRENFRGNLHGATNEDWRIILESLGTRVVAFGDGTWDVEINLPLESSIANKTS